LGKLFDSNKKRMQKSVMDDLGLSTSIDVLPESLVIGKYIKRVTDKTYVCKLDGLGMRGEQSTVVDSDPIVELTDNQLSIVVDK